jgi:anti-sigma factor RsiW
MTTSHPDETLIHDLVDDELGADERARVEAHLAACPACRQAADRIRALREDAQRAFGGAPLGTGTDQWDAIEARIDARRRARRFAPLAAAATVAVLVASGAALWAALRAPAGGDAGPVAVVAAAVETPAGAIAVAYAPTVAQLERILAAERDRLQPETVATVEANLVILNQAIRDIEAALAADPAHRGNLESLDGMYQTKIDVLQQVLSLTSGA